MAQFQRLPVAASGMRIGLYGGSFNPAHAGHRLVSLLAMRRLRLDNVWWLISPGNPLKSDKELPPTSERAEQAQRLARHPKIKVTTFEEILGFRYTVDTIAFLKQRFPGIHFVWLMGADNLSIFHQWHGWRDIAKMVPIAVIDRNGSTLKATNSRAALTLSRYRKPEILATKFASSPSPAWIFLHGPRSPLSSTFLREQRKKALPKQNVFRAKCD